MVYIGGHYFCYIKHFGDFLPLGVQITSLPSIGIDSSQVSISLSFLIQSFKDKYGSVVMDVRSFNTGIDDLRGKPDPGELAV